MWGTPQKSVEERTRERELATVKPPADVRHHWRRMTAAEARKLNLAVMPAADTYICPFCQQWSGNHQLYVADVCPDRDRRKGSRDRRRS